MLSTPPQIPLPRSPTSRGYRKGEVSEPPSPGGRQAKGRRGQGEEGSSIQHPDSLVVKQNEPPPYLPPSSRRASRSSKSGEVCRSPTRDSRSRKAKDLGRGVRGESVTICQKPEPSAFATLLFTPPQIPLPRSPTSRGYRKGEVSEPPSHGGRRAKDESAKDFTRCSSHACFISPSIPL
jgi:hypothetical protein